VGVKWINMSEWTGIYKYYLNINGINEKWIKKYNLTSRGSRVMEIFFDKNVKLIVYRQGDKQQQDNKQGEGVQ